MYFGVDYYPEHWPQDWLEKDLDTFVELGANTIRIGEFAWHLMEKQPGAYDFTYFDRVIREASLRGLHVIFGTPTATFPAWLAHSFPEILSQDKSNQVKVFGGRRQYCYNSKVYREHAARLVKALVSHYKDEPSIIAWQIDNEFGHEGSDDCYCPICHQQWHVFLKEKYETIEALNEAYGSIFWGQTYNQFEEIPMPQMTVTTHNPTLKLDWARFRSVSLNGFATEQIESVRAYKGTHQAIIHNLFGGFFERKYDQNPLANQLDVVAYDNYPVWGGLREPISPAHIAMTLDYNYGLKQQPFWIVEQLMGAQGHDIIGYRPRKGQGRLWSWQAMARGCESLLYFRERTMTRGQEQYCQGLIDADNQLGEKFEEAKQFFKEAKEFAGQWLPPQKPKVAVLYDYDNIRSWAEQPQSESFDFTTELLRLYEPFHRLNVAVEVIDLKKNFLDYSVVLLPVQQIVDEALIERLNHYVSNGGVLISSYRLGIKDRNNNLKLGEVVPGGLTSLFGMSVVGYESLHEGLKVPVNGQIGEGSYTVWRDLLKLEGATALLSYQNESFKTYVAMTENQYGKGKAVYIGGGMDKALILSYVTTLCETLKLGAIASPEGVEVIQRESLEGVVYQVVLNHNGVQVPYEEELLAPYDVLIRQVPKI